MKRIKLILPIAIFIIFTLITVVNANESNITLSASNNKIEKQEVIEVTVNLNNLQTEGAKVLTGKIEFDENVLEYVEKSFKAGWSGAVSDDGTSFNAFGYEETIGKEVLILKFKLKENVKEKETKITAKDLKLVLEESTEEQNLQKFRFYRSHLYRYR